MTKQHIPKIRFQGFDEEWDLKKLSEVSGFRRGSFPQPYGNKEWYGGEAALPFVQVIDVGNNLKLVETTKQSISKKAQDFSVFVPMDSVIVTLQGSIGRVALTQYNSYVDRTILFFESYFVNINKVFWAYTIQKKFEIEKSRAPGGTIKTITKEVLSNFRILLPSLPEQESIGQLFRTLDELISAYKNNLEHYQSLKTSMLSKMFPKEGQKQPEIRLDGFEGDWEEKCLKDIAQKFQSGGTPSTKVNEYWGGTIPWIQSSDLLLDNIYSAISKKTITESGLKNSSAKLIPKNSIAIVTRVGVGKIAIINHEFTTSQDFLSISEINGDLKFIGYSIFKLLKKEIRQLQGTSIKGITKDTLLSKKISLPSLPEQEAIGAFFANLDETISSYQDKIGQLELLKKNLLSQMFI